MGKSAKKSATKVVAAPAAVTKPLKKGKRDAEEIIEKPKSGKKQKNDVKEAIAKKVAEEKTVKKKVDTSSSDDSSDDSEPEQKVPAPKKVPVAAAKNGAVKKGKPASSESDSSDESDSDEEVPKSKVAPVTNGAAKKDESDESDSDDSSEDDAPAVVKPAIIKPAKDDSSDSDSEEEEESSDDDAPAIIKPAAVAKKGESSDESEDDSSDESSDEEPKQKKDVKMVDAQPTPKKEPATPKAQPIEGPKTLFVGNLPFSVEKADIENFFKVAGEVVDVRLALTPDGDMKGYGHVEFASAAEAKKAVEELNGQELLGRGLRLDLAKERGEYTPRDGNSFQKQTIFVRGLDTNEDEYKTKDALREHFASCGEITRISVPTDQDGYIKGIAYLDFTDKDCLNKALELDQSECGQSTLSIEEAKPRDNSAGGGRGGRGGGRFGSGGGGRFGSGGRDSGGRFGGRGGGRGGRGGGGRFGGGGRGRGPSFTASGKKTTFND